MTLRVSGGRHPLLAGSSHRPGRTAQASARPRGDAGVLAWARPATLPVSVGIAAAAFAAAGSWVPSLWGDEAATVLSATRSLPSLWAQTQHLDAVHATYYLLMHAWIGVFGAGAFSVRFPSALAVGVAAGGLVVLVRLFGQGRVLQVLTAVAYVALPRIAYIGQEARSFAWGGAFTTWTVIVVVAVVRGRIRRHVGWSLYAAVVAVSTWLLLFNAGVIAIIGLTLACSPRGRRHLRGWAVGLAVALAASTPVVMLGYAQRGQVGYLADSPVRLPSVLVSTWFGNRWFAAVAWALIVVAVARMVGRAWAWMRAPARRSRRVAGVGQAQGTWPSGVERNVLILAWAFLPVAVLLVTDPVIHLFAERYVADSAPAVALLVVSGVRVLAQGWKTHARVWPGVIATACLVAVAVPAAAYQRSAYSEDGSDWAAVASYVHAHAAPGSDVLFAQTVSPSRRARNALRLYPQDFAGLRDVALTMPWYAQSTTWYDRAMTISRAVADGRVTTPTVWVVETRGSHDEGIRSLEDAGYRRVSSRHFDLDTVEEFRRLPLR